jgi:2-polyprenyl-3-methyl-5-hydroxy-6-metoxy-1,4-benzoquinol methylase
MVDTNKLNACIDSMVELMIEMKKCLKEEGGNAIQSPPKIREAVPQVTSFAQLKESVMSDKWPEAVNKNLICDPNSESDKNERGRGVIELMIEEDLNGLKFLDFGCGEGHCANISTDYHTELSVGYDIVPFDKWKKFNTNAIFTTDFSEVMEKGPYDIILMFDVIDHLQQEDMKSAFQKARSVLKDKGRIYLRCHPFSSRHATHLYHDLNKAYLHLVFTPEELREIIPNSANELPTQLISKPLVTYGSAIKSAELKEINRREITEKVEPFFTSPEIANRIQNTLGFQSFPNFQLSLQFVDYVLEKMVEPVEPVETDQES